MARSNEQAATVELARRIRRNRSALDITQSALGKAADCHQVTVCRFERADGTLDMSVARLLLLAKIFGIPASQLLDGIEL